MITIPLTEEAAQDPALTGNKGATLSRMLDARFRVPNGFVVTTEVFATTLDQRLNPGRYLAQIEPLNRRQLQTASDRIRLAIGKLRLPHALSESIRESHRALGVSAVSVRSSSTAEAV